MVQRCNADRSVRTSFPLPKGGQHVLVAMKATAVRLCVEDIINARAILRLIAREESGQTNEMEADPHQRDATAWVCTRSRLW